MKLTNDEFLEKAFLNYYNKISKKRDYNMSPIPYNLIKAYFLYMKHSPFEDIANNYRKKYILNENKLESVHRNSERAGLRVVYDYILSDQWKNMKNIYVLLEIHLKLYSKVANPEFGGKFRNTNAYISKSDIKTSDFSTISCEIAQLYSTYDTLLKDADKLNEAKDEELLFSYLERAIKLKCRLIEIHPFADGNGRSCRALLNILFRAINLPPIYIKYNEKEEYIEAMDNAVRNKNYDAIIQFYYYKICDSIYDLDISERKTNGITVRELSKKIREKNQALSRLNTIFKKNLHVDDIDDAVNLLHSSEKIKSLVSKLFDGRITRKDLTKINSSLLLSLIDIYSDENNEVILEDEFAEDTSSKVSSLDLFLEEIKEYALLSKKNEMKLISKYQKTKSKNIKNLIINSFQKVIYYICSRYTEDEHDILNYVQEANLILLDSIETYETNDKYRFATYALFNIRKKLDIISKIKKYDIITNISKTEMPEENIINISKTETPEENIIREITNQNTLNFLQNILEDDEVVVALKMFGFNKDGVIDSTSKIANDLDKDKEEIIKIKEKILLKLKSNKSKELAKNLNM